MSPKNIKTLDTNENEEKMQLINQYNYGLKFIGLSFEIMGLY